MPVTLGFEPIKIIGRAEITGDGDIIINIPASALTKEIRDLTTVDDIRGLSIGVNYRPAEKQKEGGDAAR